jgi:hypothetical protein
MFFSVFKIMETGAQVEPQYLENLLETPITRIGDINIPQMAYTAKLNKIVTSEYKKV